MRNRRWPPATGDVLAPSDSRSLPSDLWSAGRKRLVERRLRGRQHRADPLRVGKQALTLRLRLEDDVSRVGTCLLDQERSFAFGVSTSIVAGSLCGQDRSGQRLLDLPIATELLLEPLSVGRPSFTFVLDLLERCDELRSLLRDRFDGTG